MYVVLVQLNACGGDKLWLNTLSTFIFGLFQLTVARFLMYINNSVHTIQIFIVVEKYRLHLHIPAIQGKTLVTV